MWENPRPRPSKKALWQAAGLFLVSYLVVLPLWLVVNSSYGYFVTGLGARLAASVKSVEISTAVDTKNGREFRFLKRGHPADLEMEYSLPTTRYAFNTPLTLAIMVPFFPYLKKKRVYLEALAILLSVHVLMVFFMVGEELTKQMVFRHFASRSLTTPVWNFAGSFFDNFVIRFEPFLIGTYLYFRTTAQPQRSSGRKSGN